MMGSEIRTSKWWRTRKVYSVVIRIMLSYFLLFLAGKIFGKGYSDKRLSGLHSLNANRLKNTFLELQGLFVKIGQMVSIMSTFLPEDFRRPLEAFQDHAPARPIDEIRLRISNELGGPPEKIFRSFDDEPLASASIGQVHRATLNDGTEVVVKVQHAHVPQIAAIDLELFEKVMALVGSFYKMRGLEHVAQQIRKMIEEEMDYTREAENMSRIKVNLSSLPNVLIPQTYPEYCTRFIITSEFIQGEKITNTTRIDALGLDKNSLAKQLLEMCCKMVFDDGIYHADPHPGNLHVTENGKLVLLDFGAVSTLNPRMKTGLMKLVEAVVKGDTEEIVEALTFMGFITSGKESTRVAERMLENVREFFQSEVQMESFNFEDIKFDFDISSLTRLMTIFSFREMADTMQLPKDYILLNRMLLLIAGISAQLDPKLNPLDVIQPYFKSQVFSGGNMSKYIFDMLKSNFANLLNLPVEMRKVLHKARRGELELNIRDLDKSANLLFLLWQQMMFTLLIIAIGVLAYASFENGWFLLFKYSLGIGALLMLFWLRAGWLARRYWK